MCNRLGARKFKERYKETRADLAKKRRYEKDRHGRPLYNNYLPNILNEHGCDDDKLYCPWNNWSAANRRPARLYASDRLNNIWLTAYSGKKRRTTRKSFYAMLRRGPTAEESIALMAEFAEKLNTAVQQNKTNNKEFHRVQVPDR